MGVFNDEVQRNAVKLFLLLYLKKRGGSDVQ